MQETENQPFQLKNIYNEKFLQQVAAEITAAHPQFDSQKFQKLVFDKNWSNLELKQRVRHISNCLRQILPADFRAATAVLTKTVEQMIARDGDRMTFEWMIFPDFVEAHGTDDPDCSLPALEILTRLASAEFAIRPFFLKFPDRTKRQMLAWADHPSFAVRRLASEGFRPRLPWGAGVPELKRDPEPILEVLEKLKNDPAETVRRSVANNLNDISKDHPQLVLEIAQRWHGQSEEVNWIVKHACRGLLKKGNPTALAIFGFERGAAGIEIFDLKMDASVAIGGVLNFSFSVKNGSPAAQKIRLEYAIDFLTSSGKISRKVFKIKELTYESDAGERVERRQRFQDFTTRKHFAGGHRLAILANGEVLSAADFEVEIAIV